MESRHQMIHSLLVMQLSWLSIKTEVCKSRKTFLISQHAVSFLIFFSNTAAGFPFIPILHKGWKNVGVERSSPVKHHLEGEISLQFWNLTSTSKIISYSVGARISSDRNYYMAGFVYCIKYCSVAV